jgi:hypothetical protein
MEVTIAELEQSLITQIELVGAVIANKKGISYAAQAADIMAKLYLRLDREASRLG